MGWDLRQGLDLQTYLATRELVQGNISRVVGAQVTVLGQTGFGSTQKHEAAEGMNWNVHMEYMQLIRSKQVNKDSWRNTFTSHAGFTVFKIMMLCASMHMQALW